MKFKDIAYIIENVKELKIYEHNNGETRLRTINVYSASSGESRKFFDYEVTKIDTKISYNNSQCFDNEANLKSIITVYLEKE